MLQFYLMAHNFRQAELEAHQMLELIPDDDFVLWSLGCVQVQLQHYPEAIKTFLKRKVGSRETNWALGCAYARTGELQKARLVLDFLIDKSKTTYLPNTFIGLVYLSLNEPDKAMAYIEAGFEQGDNWAVYLEVQPWFDPLRNNTRFQALINRLHAVK